MEIREGAAKMKISVFDFIVFLMDHIWKGYKFFIILQKLSITYGFNYMNFPYDTFQEKEKLNLCFVIYYFMRIFLGFNLIILKLHATYYL